jgi:hypothetical protein
MAIIKTQVPFAQINLPFGGIGVGNIYYVANTLDTVAYADLFKEFGTQGYDDGSAILYPHTSTASAVTTNGLLNALAACKTDRNDYVVVMPSSEGYYTDVLLAMTKRAVHLVCPASLTCRVGCMNEARIQQIGSAISIISVQNGGIEIAGLYLKNITGYAHIEVLDTASATESAWGLSIHNNYFVSRSSTTTLPMLYCTGDGAAYSRVENNWFTTQVSGGTWTNGVVSVTIYAVNTDVIGNIINIGNTGNASYGIRNLSTNGLVADNYFSECGTSTITSCVTIGKTGAAIGNRCAVATGHFSDGSGTAAVSYTDNTDGITNGKTAGMLTGQLED